MRRYTMMAGGGCQVAWLLFLLAWFFHIHIFPTGFAVNGSRISWTFRKTCHRPPSRHGVWCSPWVYASSVCSCLVGMQGTLQFVSRDSKLMWPETHLGFLCIISEPLKPVLLPLISGVFVHMPMWKRKLVKTVNNDQSIQNAYQKWKKGERARISYIQLFLFCLLMGFKFFI